MMATPLAGYPQSDGGKREVVCELTGPASYATFTPGPPTANGQVVYPKDIGLAGIDFCEVSVPFTTVQVYGVIVFYPNMGEHKISSHMHLVWINPLTLAQVAPGTNLSGFTVRLHAVGW
jgi:hypothetical protein